MKGLEHSLTIGIPTYYGGPGLIKTVKSILLSKGVPTFRLIICVDGNPLKPEIESELKQLGAEIILSEERGGQLERLKQMIALCDTDIILFTQDDIIFTPETVSAVVDAFDSDQKITMVCGDGQALPPTNYFEKVVNVGSMISGEIEKRWKNRDNYLSVGGRCLAFKTSLIKQMQITSSVLSSDVYFYFYNQKLGGKFFFAEKALYFLKKPNNLNEHLRQSRKFQLIPREVKKNFNIDISKSERPALKDILVAYLKIFMSSPLLTICYTGLWLYTRIAGKGLFQENQRFWDTDISTKQI